MSLGGGWEIRLGQAAASGMSQSGPAPAAMANVSPSAPKENPALKPVIPEPQAPLPPPPPKQP